jgi:hypothetical protein
MKARSIDARQPWRTDIDVVPRALVGAIVGPGGVIDASTPVVAECSPTTEMLVRSAM